MTISAKTAKMLWGRAAGRCSMPDCRMLLVLDETETDDPALIGEMAHMVADKEDGPRGISPMTPEQRDLYGNLLLLCRNHHGEIDRQPDTWPVERLQKIKSDHEQWVAESLPGYDGNKQRDDELYAGYIDQWSQLCHLTEWTGWTSAVLSHGQPALSIQVHSDLSELLRWTMKRIWPGRYPRLETAIRNFSNVLRDFLNKFNEHAGKPYADASDLLTEKFYQIDEWNPDRYHRLARQYDFHVDLVQDLVLELTRGANLVCDEVRTHVLTTFHLREGRISVMSGPHEDLSWKEAVVKYDKDTETNPSPYPGLDDFLTVRASRDMHFGSGGAPE